MCQSMNCWAIDSLTRVLLMGSSVRRDHLDLTSSSKNELYQSIHITECKNVWAVLTHNTTRPLTYKNMAACKQQVGRVCYRVPHRSRFQEVWSFFIVVRRIFLVHLIRHKFSPVQIVADTFLGQEVIFSKKLVQNLFWRLLIGVHLLIS